MRRRRLARLLSGVVSMTGPLLTGSLKRRVVLGSVGCIIWVSGFIEDARSIAAEAAAEPMVYDVFRISLSLV